SDLVIDACDRPETFIPAPFEFAGHQPVVGIDRVVLPACPHRLITSLLQDELALPQSFRTSSLAVRNHLECCLESQRRDHAPYFPRTGGVDAHIAESDALPLGGVVAVDIIANITSHPAKPVVLNLELSPTMSAAQQSGKNPTAIAHRA